MCFELFFNISKDVTFWTYADESGTTLSTSTIGQGIQVCPPILAKAHGVSPRTDGQNMLSYLHLTYLINESMHDKNNKMICICGPIGYSDQPMRSLI